MKTLVGIIFLLLLVTVMGCGGSTVTTEPSTSPPSVVTTGASAAAETTAASKDAGTRENPIPIGQETQVGDWKITVLEANPNYVTKETYEPLSADSQIVAAKLMATYTGATSALFSADMVYQFVGSGGNTFSWIPIIGMEDDITSEMETYTGASITGSLSFAVASDQVEGGSLKLEPLSFTTDDQAVFFSIK